MQVVLHAVPFALLKKKDRTYTFKEETKFMRCFGNKHKEKYFLSLRISAMVLHTCMHLIHTSCDMFCVDLIILVACKFVEY